jgi:hypothetical protein
MRDIMLPAIWIGAVSGNEFVWRGNAMNIEKAPETAGSLQLAEEEATR